MEFAHETQNVHSREQMSASSESGLTSLLQHSQFAFSRSIFISFIYRYLHRGED